jgi:hypothetical protein
VVLIWFVSSETHIEIRFPKSGCRERVGPLRGGQSLVQCLHEWVNAALWGMGSFSGEWVRSWDWIVLENRK